MTRYVSIDALKEALCQHDEDYEYPCITPSYLEQELEQLAVDDVPTTKNDLGVDCISKKNALRVANNEYLRGFHNALCKALNETYSIHCDEGHFRVIQEETLVGLGMSMESALGPDAESFMNTLPLVTPQLTEKLTKASEDAYNKGFADGMKAQEPRKGHWIKGYTFPDGAYWKCDKCNELIKVKFPMNYCNNCGAKMESEG